MSAVIEATRLRMASARPAEAKCDTHSDQPHNIFTVIDVFVNVDGERCTHHGIDKESGIILLVLVVILYVLRL